MIRIIAGRWRGRALRVPKGTATRPSASRLREALFSALAPRIRGADFADLFAGSGALGIEALSRGARHAIFVDVDPRALRTIASNLEELGADPSTWRIQRSDARRWLERQLERGDRIGADGVVLLDPPYTEEITAQLLPLGRRLVESARCGAFVLEHPASAPLPPELDEAGSALRVRTRRHGHGAFTLLERE